MEQKKNLSDWIKKQYRKLVSYVESRFEDNGSLDAEDVIQDVVSSIISIPQSIENIDGYVYQALRNRIVDLYRRKKNEPASLDQENGEGLTLYDILPDSSPDQSQMIENRFTRELVFREIEALPEDQKAVLIATEMEGLSFQQLSLLWDEPVGTLLSRKHRAIERLRKRVLKVLEE